MVADDQRIMGNEEALEEAAKIVDETVHSLSNLSEEKQIAVLTNTFKVFEAGNKLLAEIVKAKEAALEKSQTVH